MGFDAAGGPSGVILAILLVVVFAFGLSWIFTIVGLLMRAPSAVINTGFMALFPLVFLSNIFVEPDTLPSCRWCVGVNPISYLTTATRGLMQGNVDEAATSRSHAGLGRPSPSGARLSRASTETRAKPATPGRPDNRPRAAAGP